jgi:hypothetical protein
LQWLTAKNLRTAADTRGRLEKHFLPKFGDRLVSGLTKSDLDGWLASMVVESDDPERVRSSKDSANRVLSMIVPLFSGIHARLATMRRAVLNRCLRLYEPDSTMQGLARGLKCT